MVIPVVPASSAGMAAETASNSRLTAAGSRGVPRNSLGLGGDARRHRAERGGAGVEPLPQLAFDAAQCRFVRRAETRPLERPPGQTNDERGRGADAHDAQDEGQGQSQDTRVL